MRTASFTPFDTWFQTVLYLLRSIPKDLISMLYAMKPTAYNHGVDEQVFKFDVEIIKC